MKHVTPRVSLCSMLLCTYTYLTPVRFHLVEHHVYNENLLNHRSLIHSGFLWFGIRLHHSTYSMDRTVLLHPVCTTNCSGTLVVFTGKKIIDCLSVRSYLSNGLLLLC